MPDCQKIDPLVTPYVDGNLAGADRLRVDAHLKHCPSCFARVTAEAAVRGLIRERKPDLVRECASPALRRVCAEMARRAAGERPVPGAVESGWAVSRARAWSVRLAPLALAAALTIVVGGAFVYRLTESSSRVMAAELTADHVKCFAMNRVLKPDAEPDVVRGSLTSHFGWTLRLPEHPDRAGLELVGVRPCLYGEGKVAHLMYRHRGVPVSVFMLPKSVRPQEIVEVMGHEAAVWSSGSTTFVLITRESRDEVQQMASFVQAALQ
jgi:anti-sigma factor RsiW